MASVSLAWLAKHSPWGVIALSLSSLLYVRQVDVPQLDAKRGWAFATKHQLAAQRLAAHKCVIPDRWKTDANNGQQILDDIAPVGLGRAVWLRQQYRGRLTANRQIFVVVLSHDLEPPDPIRVSHSREMTTRTMSCSL